MSNGDIVLLNIFSFVLGIMLSMLLVSVSINDKIYGCEQAIGLECEVRVVPIEP